MRSWRSNRGLISSIVLTAALLQVVAFYHLWLRATVVAQSTSLLGEGTLYVARLRGLSDRRPRPLPPLPLSDLHMLLPNAAGLGRYVDSDLLRGAGQLEGTAFVADAVVADSSVFRMLGCRVTQGRVFDLKDDEPSAPTVVLITRRFWEKSVNGGSAIGRMLRFNSRSYPVVGVLDHPTLLTPQADLYFSHIDDASALLNDGGRVGVRFKLLALLNANTNLDYAKSRLIDYFASIYPAESRSSTAEIVSLVKLADEDREERLPGAKLATGAIVLTLCGLLIALQLIYLARTQAVARFKTALGKPAWLGISTSLIEAATISLLCIFAVFAVGVVVHSMFSWQGDIFTVFGVSRKAFPYTQLLELTIAVTLALAVPAPLFEQMLPDYWIRRCQVAGIYLIVLLACGGAVFGSILAIQMRELANAQYGLPRPESYILQLQFSGEDLLSGGKVGTRIKKLRDALMHEPSVSQVSLTTFLPFLDHSLNVYLAPAGSRLSATLDSARQVELEEVSPSFFKAMRMQAIAGNPLALDRTQDGIVLDSSALGLAGLTLDSAVGSLIELNSKSLRVVAVVHPFAYHGSNRRVIPTVFTQFREFDTASKWVSLVVDLKAEGNDPRELVEAVKSASGGDSIVRLLKGRDFLALSTVRQRAGAQLSSIASIAGCLIALGLIWSVTARSMELRRRDFAIRRALGATELHIFMQLARGVLVGIGGAALIGVFCGIAASENFSSLTYLAKQSYGAVAAGVVFCIVAMTSFLLLIFAFRSVRQSLNEVLKEADMPTVLRGLTRL